MAKRTGAKLAPREREQELRELLTITRADAKATRRALDRMISLVQTKHGANACCYRGLSAGKLRAWAYGRAERPAL